MRRKPTRSLLSSIRINPTAIIMLSNTLADAGVNFSNFQCSRFDLEEIKERSIEDAIVDVGFYRRSLSKEETLDASMQFQIASFDHLIKVTINGTLFAPGFPWGNMEVVASALYTFLANIAEKTLQQEAYVLRLTLPKELENLFPRTNGWESIDAAAYSWSSRISKLRTKERVPEILRETSDFNAEFNEALDRVRNLRTEERGS